MSEILRGRRRKKENPCERKRPLMNFIKILRCVFDLFTNPQVQDCLKRLNMNTIQKLRVDDDEPMVQD